MPIPGPGPGAPPPPKKVRKKPPADEKAKFIEAEKIQESGGDYQAVNADTGALGAWQVLPENLGEWLTESGQPQLSPQQFLDDPAAQNAVANTILGGYYDDYGPAGAAAMWYSGQDDPTATFGDPPVYQYVDDVLRLMGEPNLANVGVGLSGTTVFGVPVPSGRADSWAGTIMQSAQRVSRTGQNLSANARQIQSIIRRR